MATSELFVSMLVDPDEDVLSRGRTAAVYLSLEEGRTAVRVSPGGQVVGYSTSKELLQVLRQGGHAAGHLEESMGDVLVVGVLQT